MLGLNVFSLLAFIAINVFAAFLGKSGEEKRKRIIRLLCIALLSFNLCKYVLSPVLGKGIKIPVEFSSVAYFLVPLIILTKVRRLQGWAIYSGLMAGFFYYLTMIIAGGKIYASYPHYDTYISMCCHGTLYLLGVARLKTREPEPLDRVFLPLGVGCVAINAYLFRPIADTGVRLLVYELMDAVYAKQLIAPNFWNIAVPAFYVLLTVFVLTSAGLFYKLNKVQYMKKVQDDTKKSQVRASVNAAA